MDRPLTIALANSGRKWIGEIAHVAMLYEQFEQLGHRPWIICRRGFALEERARAKGWRHLALDFSSDFSLLSDVRDVRHWLQWARQEKPDVLHCHRGKDHWLGRLVAFGCGCPLVRTRHVVMPIQRHWINRWLYLNATDAILCVSQATRASFGVWQERLPQGRVILSAVDSERFTPARRSDAWRRAQASLLFQDPASGAGEPLWYGLIGRFQAIKGQHFFLEAAARVAAVRPDAHFLLAGAGSEGRKARLQAQAEALGLADRVRIAGYLDDLPEVLASLDVGVIASIGSEGSSRIALEMMASGLPLVATRVGGIPDVTTPCEAARLVPPRDPEALAHAMLAWADDPALRRQTGQRACQYVRTNHHPRQWAESVLDVYRSLLSA